MSPPRKLAITAVFLTGALWVSVPIWFLIFCDTVGSNTCMDRAVAAGLTRLVVFLQQLNGMTGLIATIDGYCWIRMQIATRYRKEFVSCERQCWKFFKLIISCSDYLYIYVLVHGWDGIDHHRSLFAYIATALWGNGSRRYIKDLSELCIIPVILVRGFPQAQELEASKGVECHFRLLADWICPAERSRSRYESLCYRWCWGARAWKSRRNSGPKLCVSYFCCSLGGYIVACALLEHYRHESMRGLWEAFINSSLCLLAGHIWMGITAEYSNHPVCRS